MSELSHKERVDRILDGRQADRPAISMWRHFYHRENTKDDLVVSTIEFQRKYDWDVIKINPRASYHIEDWGAVLQYSSDPLIKPSIISLPIRKKDDWLKIKPLPPGSGVLGEILSATRDVVETAGPEIYCLQTVFSPLSIAGDLIKDEQQFVDLLHEGPKELHTALEAITRTFRAFVAELMKTGIAGIFFATTEWASRDLLTEEEYLEFGQPYDLSVLEAAHGARFNVLHVCGKNNMLPLFKEYPSPVLSWNPFEPGNLSVHQAAQIFDKIFLTGIDQNATLLSGPSNLIKEQIDSSLKDAPSGRMMAGPGCAIKANTPDANIYTAIEAVKGWSS